MKGPFHPLFRDNLELATAIIKDGIPEQENMESEAGKGSTQASLIRVYKSALDDSCTLTDWS